MTTTDKKLREVTAREMFVKISYVYTGNASDLAEYDPDEHADTIEDEIVPMSDEAVLKRLDLPTDKAHDAEILDKAALRIEADAERQNLKVTDARAFLQTVSDRYFGKQSEMTKSYLDRAENRRAAEAAESNAKLEQLEASRAAERSQKQAQAPRMSM